MNEKVLICDDEKDIVEFIKDSLENEGYSVMTAYNGSEAIDKAMKNPDIILLDVMMPDKDGFEVCKSIRDLVNCPIIFLTAKRDEIDKLQGLAIGGDDYIIKPFSVKELKARIAAHLRREKRFSNSPEHAKLSFGDLIIDISARNLYLYNEALNLTKREFDIIEFLALNSGMVFSKEQIYEKLWGYDAEGDSSCVPEHIKNIRNKFIAAASDKSMHLEQEYIKTVWGVGYRWEK